MRIFVEQLSLHANTAYLTEYENTTKKFPQVTRPKLAFHISQNNWNFNIRSCVPCTYQQRPFDRFVLLFPVVWGVVSSPHLNDSCANAPQQSCWIKMEEIVRIFSFCPRAGDDEDLDVVCEPDEYARLVEDVKKSGIIRNNRRGLKSYKNTFSGNDFVTWYSNTTGKGKP